MLGVLSPGRSRGASSVAVSKFSRENLRRHMPPSVAEPKLDWTRGCQKQRCVIATLRGMRSLQRTTTALRGPKVTIRPRHLGVKRNDVESCVRTGFTDCVHQF
jgi:hypothetical protein